MCKLVSVEPECLESNYRENLMFFPRRDVVLLKCRKAADNARKRDREVPVSVKELLDVAADTSLYEEAFEIDFDQIQKEAENFTSCKEEGDDIIVKVMEDEVGTSFGPDEIHDASDESAVGLDCPVQRIVVVGGDYFSKEDLAQLDESERVAEIRLGAPADNIERELPSVAEEFAVDFESMDFATETLAAIYADQGYYDKAIEVYAKLILLYPEKSAYFATLVNEIKSKN